MRERGIFGEVKIGAATIAEVKSWEFEETAEELDGTTMNAGGNKTYESGSIETGGSLSCFLDATDTTGQGLLIIGESVALDLYPGGSASGKKYFTGTAKIMSRKRAGSVDGIVSFDIGFKINGGMTESTVA